MLDNFDPCSIADPDLRRLFLLLLNEREEVLSQLQVLQQENQRLKDEIRKLKGLSPRPKFPRGGGGGGKAGGKGAGEQKAAPPSSDHSSESERAEGEPKPPRKKKSKLDRIRIDRTVVLTIPPEQLPPDAVFKGYQDVVVQNLIIIPDNICFRKAKFYSASAGKTYLAPVPPGYEGGYGPDVKGLALDFAYNCQMSFPALHRFFTRTGLLVGRGQISRLLTGKLDHWIAEAAAVREAGLRSAPWLNYDMTSTRVNGKNFTCHVFANPLFTGFHTAPKQDRATVVEVLQGGALRTHRVDALALALLAANGVGARTLRTLKRLATEVTLDASEFGSLLDQYLPRLKAKGRHKIETATAVAAYRAETERPLINCMVSDDAATLQGITAQQSLCWVHDGRHYKKLRPEFAYFRKATDAFLKRYWEYYRELRAYRDAPSPAEAIRLEAAFDTLFAYEAPYTDLAACIARTRANKERLLLVLLHPELPLHNNEAELAARRRVRRRDVSFGPRSAAGMRAWDTFQSLEATTAKLGISFYAYLKDQITGRGEIPQLAAIIGARAATLKLGASWEPG